MLEMAKVWGSQDKLDTDSSVSIREELMDILHQVQNHDKRHLEVQKWLTLPPQARNLQAAVVGAVQGSIKCYPEVEKPQLQGGIGMEIKTTVQQGAGPRP